MLIPDGFAQANFMWGGSSYPTGAETTLGIDLGASPLDPVGLGAALADAYDASDLRTIQVTTCSLLSIHVKFGPVATGPDADFAHAVAGSIGSSGMAPNTALLVQKLTSIGGRQGKGRWYWPGITESDVSVGGVVDGAYVAAAQSCFNDFFDAILDAGVLPVLLHGADAPITVPYPITSFAVKAVAATQRRRMRR
jgi:hypothetical protein